ncbi:Putative diheme cytochrome c-553 [Rubellimicrobium mesophilum DSM 19309]|uniref:Putative diheme cytochrome c-553 n=1 Tax=Rubellimicrobium mesophilum DSM 19309 TaxID=442562 RepID=A0A017HJG0_9RHOB|nr:cytochrome c [Rubellimicrobium mesophilum]EYD74303.1 Putative diheme cytochrome c-553 [Rubellimicrobium mesophilum DSM 19309]
MALGRTLGILVPALIVVGAAGAYALTWRSSFDPVPRPDPASFDADLVARGTQLAAVGNCIACHTVPGGDAFAGGLAVPTPFGTVYSTNITPDEKTGIGTWSLAAFRRSLHDGLDRDGHHLYPAFPYDQFTLLSDNDVEALYAYLMTRRAVENQPPPNELPFPLNIRATVAGWKLLFFDSGRFAPDPGKSDQWNRGAYLAEGLGHCGGCHTPRNALGAREKDEAWNGGMAEGWTAYPINENSPAPIPWSADALAFYLRNGWHQDHGVSRGPMAEVTGNLGRLSDEGVEAIAVYTASRMGAPEVPDAGPALAASVIEAPGEGQTSDTQTQPEDTDEAQGQASGTQAQSEDAGFARGAEIYAAACASCHEGDRPQPYGGLDFHLSTAVNASNPQNIVIVTFWGLPPADGMASAVMPGFEGVLSDLDTINLLTYLRREFTDKPDWEGVGELVTATRTGEHPVSVRPADMIERAPRNLGAKEEP